MALSGTLAVLALMLNAQNIQAEKVNLVGNFSFEYGVENWTGPGAADSGTFTNGKSSLKLDGVEKPGCIYDSQNITANLKPSTKYVFSVDIKRATVEKGTVYAAVLEKAKQDDKGWTSTHACGSDGQAGKWEHFELKFTTGTEINFALVILYNVNTGGAVWYDNVSLVEAE